MDFDKDLKFHYTKNNHFRWGWDSWFGKYNPDTHYKIGINSVSRKPESFRKECVKAAEFIANHATKPIMVGLSGGSDSQMASLSFLEAKVPFEVLILRYRKESYPILNQHDIAVAYEFCRKFNVKYNELDVDLDDFYANKLPSRLKKYNKGPSIGTIYTLVQTLAMDHACKEHCFIMAGGDIVFTPPSPNRSMQFNIPLINANFGFPCWNQTPIPNTQHMIDNDYEGTSKFFMYTPELIASYLSHPVMQSFLENCDIILDSYWDLDPSHSRIWKCFHYLYKPIMTRSEFPEMVRTKKFMGFENVDGTKNILHSMEIYHQYLQRYVDKNYKEENIYIQMDKLLKKLTEDFDQEIILHSKNS